MNFVPIRNGWQNGGAPGREKGRGNHQESAEYIQQPHLLLPQGQYEPQRNHRPSEVAGDHDPLPVKTVEQHACQWPDGDGRNGP